MIAEDNEPEAGTGRWMEALTWQETLERTEEGRLDFVVYRQWRGWYANAENRRIFEQVTQIAADARRLACQSSQNASLRPWRVVGFAAVAMAALAILLKPLLSIWPVDHDVGRGIYDTGVGEVRNARLTDGSQITLGGGTKVVTSFSGVARNVDLVQGEAWFRVVHNPRWPFVVHAGQGTIRDVGTVFLVRRDFDRVVVTVTEGTVAVSAPPRQEGATSIARSAAIRLVGGERLSYRDNGLVASVAHVDAVAATAWMHGRLVFDDEPLRYVIDDVNRYSSRHVFVTPAAGGLRFSGVVLDGKIEGWLRGLPRILAVEVDEENGSGCVRIRTSQPRTACNALR